VAELDQWGWDTWLEERLKAAHAEGRPGRVVADHGSRVVVAGLRGETMVAVPGRLLRAPGGRPVVGDWIVVSDRRGSPVATALLERRTALERRLPREGRQVLAANVDLVFVTVPLLDVDSSPVDRLLAVAGESGAEPVLLLSKADLADPQREVDRWSGALDPVPVIPTSRLHRLGLDRIRELLKPGLTAAFIGPSGAGKSTLINLLLGEERQRVGELDAGGRGRHTTSGRHLFLLSGGGLVMDTPGIRRALIWDGADALEDAFPDVIEVGLRCRFADCEHRSEPGCAVVEAVQNGTMAADRLEGYHRLRETLSRRS
jgi:ribosome biogenesis GTPase / thiamine phosphate phosphatase